MTEDERKFELAAGKALSAEEAERLLVRLQGYFKQPVQPVGRYCQSLRTWQEKMHERASLERARLYPGIDGDPKDPATIEALNKYSADKKEKSSLHSRGGDLWGYEEVCRRIDYVFLQISKSNLLWRLIYNGEEPRITMCPEHQGHWSGCSWEPPPCGCDLIGWLPNA